MEIVRSVVKACDVTKLVHLVESGKISREEAIRRSNECFMKSLERALWWNKQKERLDSLLQWMSLIPFYLLSIIAYVPLLLIDAVKDAVVEIRVCGRSR